MAEDALDELKTRLDQEWEVRWEMPYAEWVEWGTGPHGISEEGQANILAWVQRKLGLSGKKAEEAANAIMWNIRKHGTDAHPFVRPAADEIARRAGNILANNADGYRAICDAIVARAGEILSETGHEDIGALASYVTVRRIR